MAACMALVLGAAAAGARAAADTDAATAATARPPLVVASIAPVHSLVAGVMRGAASPRLLVPGGGTPHGNRLRPSAARALANADLVFWIGPGLETFLQKPLRTLAGGGRVVELAAAPGIALREIADDDGDGGRRAALGFDPHIWLDPDNARAMVAAIAAALAAADPPRADLYRANAARLEIRLAALDRELAATVAPVRGIPYVVFHDAYSYFERRYGLAAVAVVTVSPERAPGARRVRAIRRAIVGAGAGAGVGAGNGEGGGGKPGVRCVFVEPQFSPALAARLVEGTAARLAALDPLGVDLAPGPEAYFTLMRRLAGALAACLAPGD